MAEGAKERGLGGPVAQVRHHMGGKRMLDDGQRHFWFLIFDFRPDEKRAGQESARQS
jgi:hypothetical protein